MTRPGDQPDPDADAVAGEMGGDRGSGDERAPRRAPSPDPGDTRNLERGEADHLGDDAFADRQLGARHDADSRDVAGSSSRDSPAGGATSASGADDGVAAATFAAGAKAAPMSSGTFVRAIVAATPTP